jgi:hypothetical protein
MLGYDNIGWVKITEGRYGSVRLVMHGYDRMVMIR